MTAPSHPPQKPPTRPPDLDGPAPAWKINMDGIEPSADHAQVGDSYLIHSPMSHPFWSWHFIAMIHLRPLEGQSQAPTLQFEGATHEVLCFAIDPSVQLPDPDDWVNRADGTFLQPADWIIQFHVHSDEQALGVYEAIMRAATSGMIVDSDARQWWRDSIAATAQHFREGAHG